MTSRPQPAVDHRRATAERNAAGILDATERLLASGAALTMRAIAEEAGVSRPTLYAHYKTIGEIVEAAAERAVGRSLAAFEAARPGEGPAGAALERMVATSWSHIARYDALARGAAEHLSPAATRRSHRALMAPLSEVVERGQREGAFRTDLPIEWLTTLYVSLVHAAGDHARTHRLQRDAALAMLTTTIRDLLAAR